jgi:hypothetical protein
MDETVWTNKIINYTIHAPGSPSVAPHLAASQRLS